MFLAGCSGAEVGMGYDKGRSGALGWLAPPEFFIFFNLCGTNHTDLALGHSYHSVFQTPPVEEGLGLLIGFFPITTV